MKWINMLFMISLLAGCGSGIMPERYDGEVLEKDAEAVALYEAESKLLDEGLEDRYHFVNGEVERTAESSGAPVTIDAGRYEIGGEIEAGRYTIEEGAPDAYALLTYDTEGVRVNEMAGGLLGGQLVLDLTEGMVLEYKVRDGEIGLVPVEEMMLGGDAGTEMIVPAGIHEVGKHLDPGEYTLLSDELPIRRADGENDIYVNHMASPISIMNGPEPEREEVDGSEMLVTLDQGDMIITEYPITIRKE